VVKNKNFSEGGGFLNPDEGGSSKEEEFYDGDGFPTRDGGSSSKEEEFLGRGYIFRPVT
jgi:hypothetical protein